MKPWLIDGKISYDQNRILKNFRVMNATPCYQSACYSGYARSLFNTLQVCEQQSNMKLCYGVLGGGFYIEAGRNKLVQVLLESDCTHIFFIDADEAWEAKQFFEMLLTERELIGAPVPRKTLPIEPTHLELESTTGLLTDDPREVQHFGGGFMCIKREAFKTYREFYPGREMKSKAEFEWEYFTPSVREGVRGGEDVWFCQDMARAGVRPFLAPWVNVEHFGGHLFR